MKGPVRRPRRLRSSPALRNLVREHRVEPGQLVLPMFLTAGTGVREAIEGLPGIDRCSVDEACRDVERGLDLGVNAFALFPREDPADKSADGALALRDDNLACRALRELRSRFPEAVLVADVALDPYSTDGHDGIVRDGRVVNDETVEILARMAVVQARAGANVVAPSDMMDGRIGAIRAALDAEDLVDTVILSYAVKYASTFYGPFRSALDSAPVNRPGVPTDKRTYQMDPANAEEALLEAALDVDEGADILMVKPGLPYLDVVARLADAHPIPIAAYQVSGEFAMLKVAAERGLVDYHAGLEESLTCFVRAGARLIFTYGALDFADHRRAESRDGS